MSDEVWKLSGGSPRFATGTLTVGSGSQDTTIVAVASGKRIIPAWLFLWGLSIDTNRITNFVVRGVAALDGNRSTVIVDNFRLQPYYFQPIMFRFGIMCRNLFADGDDLKIAVSSPNDLTTVGDTYRYAIGYYLVDA